MFPGADPGEVKWVNFRPPFSEPLSFFFFSYLLHQALILLHCYKNSPPISKSWIRAWFHFISGCFSCSYTSQFNIFPLGRIFECNWSFQNEVAFTKFLESKKCLKKNNGVFYDRFKSWSCTKQWKLHSGITPE